MGHLASGESRTPARVRAPTRGNRRLEALLEAADEDPEIRAWWHMAQVNSERLGMSDHSWVHVQIVLNIDLRLLRLLVKAGVRPAMLTGVDDLLASKLRGTRCPSTSRLWPRSRARARSSS